MAEVNAKAYVNHGRWLARCPDCSGANLVTRGELMVCGHTSCFPGLNATAQRIKPGLEDLPPKKWLFVNVPDLAEREATRQEAIKRGKGYEVEFPSPRQEQAIMKALRPRPVDAMNWQPGETVNALNALNQEMGVS